MNSISKRFYDANSKAYAILIFILCTVVSSLLIWHMEVRETRRLQERAYQAALIQGSRIQQALDEMLSTTKTLKVFLEQGQGRMDNFPDIAASVMKGYPIFNMALAPDGVISQIYPYIGNEAAMGHDLLHDPARATESRTAKVTKEYTLAGPYELKQGGTGIIGRLPVFLKDNNQEEYFWGFVCITLKIPDAFSTVAMERLDNLHYSYEVWRVNPDTQTKQVILASAAPIRYQSQQAKIELPNSTWYLSLAPTTGWINEAGFILWCLVSLAIALLLSQVFYYTWELARKKQELDFTIRQQSANYHRMNQLNQELRIFKHDMNNHLLSLNDLLEHEDVGDAKEYISNMTNHLISAKRFINTENYVFDALLAQKLETARQLGICAETEIIIPGTLKIKNADWSTLFGNALDNAIEACGKIKSGDKRILIFVKYTGDMLKVRILNTASHAPIMADRRFLTSKQDSIQHGIGMGSMAAVVKRYHGEIDAQFKDGMFTLSFVLLNV